jgi:hypothetical protein
VYDIVTASIRIGCQLVSLPRLHRRCFGGPGVDGRSQGDELVDGQWRRGAARTPDAVSVVMSPDVLMRKT